ncbi:MAG TPA: NAD(P)H-binding protein, partial [Solirubrobacteraceae bacterium]|nr:NAD(P)H-binding protein [Solirubrobacteraceae bacterium]
TILVTGATGYVGGRLIEQLGDRNVRALARDPARASLPVEVVRGDVVSGAGLDRALDGVDVAYYLVHAMGARGDFAERDRRGARTFGEAARRAGVRRVVYLGGLEGAASEHLRSREEVAAILAEHVPTVHARAAMVIGAGSASFVMLRKLTERLPAMVTPRWLDTRSQPIAVRDVVGALAALAAHDDPPAEVQLGGADVLTYREMVERVARLRGLRPRVVVPVPVLTPRLSSYWVRLVTGVDLALVVPLVEGLAAEMTVKTPPPPGVNDAPLGFDDAVRAALG